MVLPKKKLHSWSIFTHTQQSELNGNIFAIICTHPHFARPDILLLSFQSNYLPSVQTTSCPHRRDLNARYKENWLIRPWSMRDPQAGCVLGILTHHTAQTLTFISKENAKPKFNEPLLLILTKCDYIASSCRIATGSTATCDEWLLGRWNPHRSVFSIRFLSMHETCPTK